jgi:hypothetical protein
MNSRITHGFDKKTFPLLDAITTKQSETSFTRDTTPRYATPTYVRIVFVSAENGSKLNAAAKRL